MVNFDFNLFMKPNPWARTVQVLLIASKRVHPTEPKLIGFSSETEEGDLLSHKKAVTIKFDCFNLQEEPDPTFCIDNKNAIEIMNTLWFAGFRPNNVQELDSTINALKAEVEYLRRMNEQLTMAIIQPPPSKVAVAEDIPF